MSEGFRGRCLCGAVTYVSRANPMMGGHCYCVDCRKTSGTGHGSHAVVAADALSISGTLSGYEKPADSGNSVTRYFCPTCGAPIYSTNSAMDGRVFVRASSMDDLEDFQPTMVVYAKRAASWDRIQDENIPRFETAPSPKDMPI